MIVRLTEIIRRQLIADTGFGPVQVRGKLGQKCQIRFFSFDDPAGDGQTVDRRESVLTCMRGKENDAAIIFLYYFNDLTGALMTAFLFCFVTWLSSVVATWLPEIWYGIGVFIGSFVGFCVAYARLRWLEKNLDEHVFCRGSLLRHKRGVPPESKVFDRYKD